VPLFAFKSDIHFVGSSDGTILQIYELTKPTIHVSSVHKEKITTIDTSLEQQQEEDESYHGLMFFDGHGRIEGQRALTMLAKHLKDLHLLVNPEGYCFQQVSELGTYSDFGIHYLRLNDLFSWPRYGVHLVKINLWSRLELKWNPNKHSNPPKQISSPDKYDELKRLLKEKDEELGRLKEEMEANEESKTSRIKELEGAIEAKNEELRKMKKEKDGGDHEKCRARIEELENLNEAKDQDLDKLRNEKKKRDEELQMCAKEVEKLKGEMEKKKNDELEGNASKKKVEALELEMLREKVKHLTLRRGFPPQSITCHPQRYYTNTNYKLVDMLRASDVIRVWFVDDRMSYGWPEVDSLIMYTGGDVFDVQNWWTVRVRLQSGQIVILAYYDGNFSQVFLQGFMKDLCLSVQVRIGTSEVMDLIK
ncbi:hypothetical protein LINGRAHAP2_LOCUS8131, partial [Linum grandiflorum]